VDGLFSVLDEEGRIVGRVSVVEISGPWSVTDNNHFNEDAKNQVKVYNFDLDFAR
jgi:hypothetical protein